MKFKTTAKEIKNGYYYVIPAGYCALQSLLSYKSPVAYSCGVYGWNFDLYDIDGVAIVTGYRTMPQKNVVKNCYSIANDFEDKSQGKTAEEKEVLIHEFIQFVKVK